MIKAKQKGNDGDGDDDGDGDGDKYAIEADVQQRGAEVDSKEEFPIQCGRVVALRLESRRAPVTAFNSGRADPSSAVEAIHDSH